jgi:hypothetical protein
MAMTPKITPAPAPQHVLLEMLARLRSCAADLATRGKEDAPPANERLSKAHKAIMDFLDPAFKGRPLPGAVVDAEWRRPVLSERDHDELQALIDDLQAVTARLAITSISSPAYTRNRFAVESARKAINDKLRFAMGDSPQESHAAPAVIDPASGTASAISGGAPIDSEFHDPAVDGAPAVDGPAANGGRTQPVEESSGGDVDYYRVHIASPKRTAPYIAECEDIIEALGMDFHEGNAFKSVWRRAAARTLGKRKAGNTARRDAEKIAHAGGRLIALDKARCAS